MVSKIGLRRHGPRTVLAAAIALLCAGTITATPAYAANRVGRATFFSTGVSQVSDVASGADSSVWVTGVTGTFNIVRGTAQAPATYSLAGSRIAVGPDGLPWIIDFGNRIFRGNADGTVSQVTGLAHDIGVGQDGSVWIVSNIPTNGSWAVEELISGGFVIPLGGGSGLSIDVSATGQPVVNGIDGKIWQRDPSGRWAELTGRANDVAVTPNFVAGGPAGGSALWIAGRNAVTGGGGIWNFNGGDWWFFPGQGATEITVGNQGVWFVNNNGNLFRVAAASEP